MGSARDFPPIQKILKIIIKGNSVSKEMLKGVLKGVKVQVNILADPYPDQTVESTCQSPDNVLLYEVHGQWASFPKGNKKT